MLHRLQDRQRGSCLFSSYSTTLKSSMVPLQLEQGTDGSDCPCSQQVLPRCGRKPSNRTAYIASDILPKAGRVGRVWPACNMTSHVLLTKS